MDRSIPYVQPRRAGAPPTQVPKGKYVIPLPHIPHAITLDGSLLGRLYELGFADHDFQDKNKFLDFRPQYYMNSTVVELGRPPVMHFQQWALGLETSSITNLLDIPHFGRSLYITCCVKTLVSCVHGGYLLLNPPSLLTQN